jgi:hypothetical protein
MLGAFDNIGQCQGRSPLVLTTLASALPPHRVRPIEFSPHTWVSLVNVFLYRCAILHSWLFGYLRMLKMSQYILSCIDEFGETYRKISEPYLCYLAKQGHMPGGPYQ